MDKDPIMDVDLNVSYDENSSEDDEPKKETKLIESTTLENEICRKLSEINKNNEIAVVNVGEEPKIISIESIEGELNKFNKLFEYKNRLLFFSGMNKSLGLEAINLMNEDTYNLRKEQFFTTPLSKAGYDYTLESVNNNLINLWKKIIEFIKKIWNKIVSFFKKDKNNGSSILTENKKEVIKLQDKTIGVNKISSLLSDSTIYPLNNPKESYPQINNFYDLLDWVINSNKDIKIIFDELIINPHPYIVDLMKSSSSGGIMLEFFTDFISNNITSMTKYTEELLNSYNVILNDLINNKELTEKSKEAESYLNENMNNLHLNNRIGDSVKSPKYIYTMYDGVINKLKDKSVNNNSMTNFDLFYKSFFDSGPWFIKFFDDGLNFNNEILTRDLNNLCDKIHKTQNNLSNINLNDQIQFDVSKLAEWSNYIFSEFSNLNKLMSRYYEYSNIITNVYKKFYILIKRIGNAMKSQEANMNWNENGKKVINLLKK